MKDFRDRPAQFTDLQGRAEKLLQTKQKVQPLDLPPEDAARLIHELQMHQVELELKNEELRQVQARLEESRNKYSHLYDFAPVGYVTLDQLGKIVEANFSAASLLGCKRGRLLGEYLPLFMPYQDQKSFRKLLGKMADGQKRRGEFHLENKNGQMLVLLLDVLLGLDAKGQKSYLVSLTDITEVKQVQKELRLHREDLEKVVANRTAELREANENLRALFTAAPLAIGVFDAQGKTVSVNPAAERIFGWTQEELVGRLPLYIPPESPEESLEVWEWALQGEP